MAIIWPIRKSFQCILQGVRFSLAKQTRLSGTSDNEFYATSPQGVEKVKEEQGGFAFMMEDAGIQYLVERNCELAQVSN